MISENLNSLLFKFSAFKNQKKIKLSILRASKIKMAANPMKFGDEIRAADLMKVATLIVSNLTRLVLML